MRLINPDSADAATVTARGAARWTRGHPWIFRSDVMIAPDQPGLVRVTDERGRFLGQALHSPASEIRLRLLERSERKVDGAWWKERISASIARRGQIDATAYRLVHGEGDGLPSLIADRYDRWVVLQLLSAGLETMRGEIVDAVREVAGAEGVLLRNDAAPGAALAVELVAPAPNRHAYGAIVELEGPAGVVARRWITGGGSYQSVDAPVAYFGLGSAGPRSGLRIQVRWPDGSSSSHPLPQAARMFRIDKPAGAAQGARSR